MKKLDILDIEDNRKYKVITLCGSTKFKDEYTRVNFALTMQGHMVFSVGWFSHADADIYTPTLEEKEALDDLHKRKIMLSDEIFVIDVNGYIGESTRGEIAYARTLNLPVRFFSEEGYPGK